MIQFDGYTYRNIQEQVAQNATDIDELQDELDGKQDALTAGSGISIDSSNVISASSGTQLYKHDLWFEDETQQLYFSVSFVSNSATPITAVNQLVQGIQGLTIIDFVFRTGNTAYEMKVLGARGQGAGVYEFWGYDQIMLEYGGTPTFTSDSIDTESNTFPAANFHDTIVAL